MLLCSSTERLSGQAAANLRSLRFRMRPPHTHTHLLLAPVAGVICPAPLDVGFNFCELGRMPGWEMDVEYGGRPRTLAWPQLDYPHGPSPAPPRGPPRPAGGGREGGLLRGGLRAAKRQQTPCLPAASLVRHLSRGSGAEPVASFFKILVTAGAGFLRQS